MKSEGDASLAMELAKLSCLRDFLKDIHSCYAVGRISLTVGKEGRECASFVLTSMDRPVAIFQSVDAALAHIGDPLIQRAFSRYLDDAERPHAGQLVLGM
ncbi:hypothetical protein SAMN06265795_104261 [Noviherbaspirillum humi]|uniref:Uncharacterized protein n=1 Tax=Noviherbaspirillum humi TaxID=1688639 RepID=A0A239G8Q0_9BURK|nr:hypothetical protein [Noviherbaspirillum humi]SNS64404.1 hypothetical protein SAMN06265795_104261 [Noviherbaspirillum humi]